MERILTTQQMRLCEQESDRLGVSLAELMDNAGEGLARKILKTCHEKMIKTCTILVGKGNNGGDGLVAANYLANSGIETAVVLCCGEPDTDLSSKAFSRLYKSVSLFDFTSSANSALEAIAKSEIICDCIFGTGFHGNLRENVLPVFAAANNSGAFRIACDIPSGANAQSGQADEHTFKADRTVTFHRKKIGMTLSPCKYFCGEIVVCPINIPSECEEKLDFTVEFCDNDYAKTLLPNRVPYGHKGTFGKLVTVAGSRHYIGAAGLCTTSALRTGVGLCELCTVAEVVSSLSQRLPECIYSEMKCDNSGFMTSENADEILKRAAKSNCILIGCGLGHTAETEKLVEKIVTNSTCTLVCDADGINSLAANIDVLQKKQADVILTPHPAELARLCGKSLCEVMSDRLCAAMELAKKFHVTVLSKSAETILCTPTHAIVISCGNTALAKGGSGDMLAGIVSSFVAQGCTAENACVLASWVMGKTAEKLSENKSERGILASDIISELPVFLKTFEE